jgi:polar amino acid transport system substrate-binding protein
MPAKSFTSPGALPWVHGHRSRRRWSRNSLLVLFLFEILPISTQERATASEPDRPLRVATGSIAPFVIRDGERLTGFSVDLWNALASRMGVQFSWTMVASPTEAIEALRRGDVDVAISAIAITPSREKLVDFSHPYLDSGLQIMVHGESEGSFSETVRAIPWSALAKLLGAALVIVFLLANVLWLVDRRGNPDLKRGYVKALGESLWGTMLIIATGEHGDRNAPGVLKRITVATMWLLGVVLIAQLTATVTSSQTVRRLKSSIRGPEDLPGKVLATFPGSVGADYLTKRGLPFVAVHDRDDAIKKLLRDEARAIVFAAPTLQYWAAKQGQAELQVVGPLFQPERIGIAVGEGSPLRKRINTAMDELYDDGTYGEIYGRWFKPAN